MLTGPELRRIFQVGDGEDVPEFEVVNIHHRRHRRSADSQAVHQVNIFNILKIFRKASGVMPSKQTLSASGKYLMHKSAWSGNELFENLCPGCPHD